MANDAVSEAGDGTGRPAFVELYHQAYRPMVSLAHLLTGSNGAAEELVQDAFVRMYGRYDAIDNPGGYLRVSVVNGCRSWHRRRARERNRQEAQTDVSGSCDPGHDDMADALAMLNPRQRAAIVLRYYHDLPEAEIARLLSCRPGTVKSLLSRGIERLKGVIEL